MAVMTLQKGVPADLTEHQAQLLESHVDVGQLNLDIELETMVQTFMVVQCYSCKTFQVHQVKKVNKWVCKICNEKQSVLKTYGKGSARDCGKQVKKLNMLRGERERGTSNSSSSNGGSSTSGGIRGSHPPDEYARTFTTKQRKESLEKLEYPVVLADTRKSKWTTFLEPSKDEDEDESTEFTTDKEAFLEATKTRRKARRSLSERKPYLMMSRDQTEEVCPYSSVNLEMEQDNMYGSKPSLLYHTQDRYTKLGMPSEPQCGHSQSMCDLTSTSPSRASPDNHKEWMSQIKQDLEKFSAAGSSGKGEGAGSKVASVPKVSSRWSQFMDGDGEGVASTNEEREGGI